MPDEPSRVSELGELRLIERFRSRLPAAPEGEVWSGDDCALLTPGEARLAVTTDVLVENVDFDLAYASGRDVGWKALAANVSDLAAVAATPRYAVVALSLPAHTPVATVDGILEGLTELGSRCGLALVGGDVSEASEISIAITAFGNVERPVLRSGARAGDLVCVTGTLGGAAGGLIVLRDGIEGTGIEELRRRQLRPFPRWEAAAVLAGQGAATASIDVSDGLVVDLEHVLDASGVGCEIDAAAVPVDPALEDVDLGVEPLELALTGGEDFELLVTMPADGYERVRSMVDVTRIGVVTESDRTISGRSLDRWRNKGWEHLRTP